jgi:hypothetical protein
VRALRRWVPEHPEVSGILTIGLVLTVSALIYGDGFGALVAAAIGLLMLGLYLGLNWVLDQWDARRERPKI